MQFIILDLRPAPHILAALQGVEPSAPEPDQGDDTPLPPQPPGEYKVGDIVVVVCEGAEQYAKGDFARVLNTFETWRGLFIELDLNGLGNAKVCGDGQWTAFTEWVRHATPEEVQERLRSPAAPKAEAEQLFKPGQLLRAIRSGTSAIYPDVSDFRYTEGDVLKFYCGSDRPGCIGVDRKGYTFTVNAADFEPLPHDNLAPWYGGTRPVAATDIVDVLFRDGMFAPGMPAWLLTWGRGVEGIPALAEVVAYGLFTAAVAEVPAPKTEPPKSIKVGESVTHTDGREGVVVDAPSHGAVKVYWHLAGVAEWVSPVRLALVTA